MTPVLERLPAHRWPAPPGDALVANLRELRPWIDAALTTAPVLDLARVRLRSPVANPGKVIAVRSNYPGTDSASATVPAAAPEFFLKSPSSVAGPSDGLELRLPGRQVDHEVELVAVIGRRVEQVTAEQALASVAGYCIGIDVTMRGPEDRGLRKSLEGFTVLGPWLVTADEVGDAGRLGIELAVNGELRQRGDTAQMRHGIATLVAAAAGYFVLNPGDVIMTGTPAGVGPLARGDTVRCTIERIGTMHVPVRR